MKFFNQLIVLAAAVPAFVAAAATPGCEPDGDHQYQAPSGDDVRSPCPGLNVLANHGYLPRSGRNLTQEMVLQAIKEGFNYNSDVFFTAVRLGILSSTDINTFSLESIRLHGNIEQDTSLSRGDFATGDNYSFNETCYSALPDQVPDSDTYDTNAAAGAMRTRLEVNRVANPELSNTQKEFQTRAGTSALYLTAMGDAMTGIAPKEFVDIFFREERMPIEEGWTRSETEITSDMVNSLVGAIIQAQPDWVSDDAEACIAGTVIISNSQGNTTTI